MAETFHLHNRLRSGVSMDLSSLEGTARDRKDLLQRLLLQLKKSNIHLQFMTDEEISEEE